MFATAKTEYYEKLKEMNATNLLIQNNKRLADSQLGDVQEQHE